MRSALAFSDLVKQSTSDKALVSRTLKLLEGRGLVELQAEGNTPRKKVYCAVTPRARPCTRKRSRSRAGARPPRSAC